MKNIVKRKVLLRLSFLMTCGLLVFSCSQDERFEEAVLTEDEFIVANLNSNTIQAENYDAQSGIQKSNGGSAVGYIQNGDWIRFEDFDYSGANSVSVRASSRNSGGTIEFRAGGVNSDLLGTVSISGTGSWTNFQNFSGSINDDSNNSDLYLVFKGGNGSLFDVDSFSFSGSSGGGSPSGDTNLALGKTAEQISTRHGGIASRAVDGDTNGKWTNGSVTHTVSQSQPWWQVRLGQEYEIGQIVIWNRTDNCCVSRLSNFDVFVYRDNGSQAFKTTITGTPSPSVTINTGGVVGSRVRVKLKGTNPLSLAEVQVFGEAGNNGGGNDGDDGGNNGGGGDASDIIGGRSDWKLNGFSGSLSVGSNDNGLDYADDASQNESHFFFENNGYATFRCYPGSPTSGGSSNPRSELREEIDGGSNYWDGTTNTERSMKWRFKVEDLPPSGKLCFGQIHERSDKFDDVIRVQVEGSAGQNSGSVKLRILGYVTEEIEGSGRTIDFDMNMDTEYYFELTMRNSVVTLYNLNNSGNRTSTLFQSVDLGDTDENYFKAGCYLQSTKSSHAGSNVYGQVAIRSISVSPND